MLARAARIANAGLIDSIPLGLLGNASCFVRHRISSRRTNGFWFGPLPRKHSGMARAVRESQRDSITQPRVDPQRGATLGHRPTNFINPERVESPTLNHATPFNPFRVDDFICTEPRVGAGAPTLG